MQEKEINKIKIKNTKKNINQVKQEKYLKAIIQSINKKSKQ